MARAVADVESGRAAPAGPPHGAFVGRQRELDELRRALAAARDGRGGLYLLSGEPGVGKTSLAERLAEDAAASGFAVAWGRCTESGGAPAYWPWVQMLRQLLPAGTAVRPRDLAELVAELARARSVTGGWIRVDTSTDARFALFEAVHAVLAAAAAERPALLVLDDLHAGDESSLLLLQYLARELSHEPILVLAAHRDWEVHRAPVARRLVGELARASRALALRGLTESEVREVLQAAIAEVPAALVTALLRATAGNPFFVHELVRLLRTQGRLDAAGGADQPFGVPSRVREAVRRRLELLGADCRAMLAVAAVAGQEFDRVLVGQVCPLAPEQMAALAGEAMAAGMLVPHGRHDYAFAHGLIREVLYDGIPAGERARLHARLGDALEARGAGEPDVYFGELAHHFYEAAQGGIDPGKAVAHARRAAAHAMRRLAFEEAVVQLQRALLALDLHPAAGLAARAELLLELAVAQRRTGESDAARDTFARAAVVARRLGDVASLAHAALGFGGIGRELLGADHNWIALLEEALAALGTTDDVLRARVEAALAMALFWTDSTQRCDALSRDAVARARRLGDPATLGFALDCRLKAVWDVDGLDERVEAAGEMLELAHSCGDRALELEARRWQVVSLLERGDIHGLDREIAAFDRLAQELHDPLFSWQSLVWHAMRAILDGDLERAGALAAEALASGERVQRYNAMPVYLAQMFQIRWLRGTLGELAGAIGAMVGDTAQGPAYRCGLSHVLAHGGDANGARREIDFVAPGGFAGLPRNASRLSSLAVVADAVAIIGAVEHAPVLYQELLPWAGRNIVLGPALACFGVVDRFLGVLAATDGRLDDAERHLQAALALDGRLGARPWIAVTQAELAAVLLRRGGPGDGARAAELSAAATATAEALNMVGLLERTRALRAPVPTSPGPAAALSCRCVREGEIWSITFEGVTTRVRDTKGMRYLRVMLGEPGREFHVLGLVADIEGGQAPGRSLGGTSAAALAAQGMHRSAAGGDAGVALDAQARAAYRARWADLTAERDEAEAANDIGRRDRVASELAFLERELSRAVGLGGRVRRANSPVELARVSVTRAVRAAIRRLQKAHPALGEHLDRTIRTGAFCAYEPDPRLVPDWQI